MKKESPHGSLLPESFIKRSVRNVAKRVVPVSLTAAVTSLMIAACGGQETTGNDQSFSNPEILPVSGNAREELISSTPTLQPDETKKPAVAERKTKSLEQQANEVALDKFLYPLSHSQSQSGVKWQGIPETNLTSTILNRRLANERLAGFPRNEIVQGKKTDSKLLFNWVYSIKLPDAVSDDDRFWRSVGQGELENIKLHTYGSGPETEADKMNGIQWTGSTYVTYVGRWRFLVPYVPLLEKYSDVLYSGTSGTDEEWSKAHTELTVPFTEWQDFETVIRTMLKNGQWTSEFDSPYLGSSRNDNVYYPIPISAYSTTIGHVNESCESPRNYEQIAKLVPGCQPYAVNP